MMPKAIKADDQKPRFDLIPPNALIDVARVFTFGAKKYEDHNWMRGFRWGRLFASTMRHLWSWWGGETNDSESGLPHLAHATCCILMLLEYSIICTMDDVDDRPIRFLEHLEDQNECATTSVHSRCCDADSDGDRGAAT